MKVEYEKGVPKKTAHLFHITVVWDYQIITRSDSGR